MSLLPSTREAFRRAIPRVSAVTSGSDPVQDGAMATYFGRINCPLHSPPFSRQPGMSISHCFHHGDAWELGQPKTPAGRRSIALPADCIDALKRHRAQQAEERLRLGPLWEDHGFVFTGHTGWPLHVNSLDAQFRKLIESAGVPEIMEGDLRHSSAILMLLIGDHPKIVQEHLRHSDISMTLNRYSHVTPSMQKRTADNLSSALNGAESASS